VSLADSDREALYARLSAHAAADHLELVELERRIAAVDRARTRDEAFAVLADLPPLPVGRGASRARRPRWGQGHGDVDRPDEGWLATSERFRDPRSGRVMRVWEDAAGGRHYLPDSGS
jgi:hypothetical protein